MYSQEMYGLGAKSSVIRELFAYGQMRRAEVGYDNVYDFSLGNPSVPSPKEVQETIIKLLQEESPLTLHGYTAGAGDISVRNAIAGDLNERFGTVYTGEDLYMTCGAAASLKICLTALYEEGDEALALTPFFPEYTVFFGTAGYKFSPVRSEEGTFQPDMNSLEAALTPKTKVLVLNSPNNPSGVVYTREKLTELAALLERKEKEYGHPIYIMSDEPYRELAYGREVPYIPTIYKDTFVCYSYSKSLSLPGERIGYIAVNPRMEKAKELFLAVCGAGRALGYVCAPSLMQQVIKHCVHVRPDLEPYEANRQLIYKGLTELGYECIYPDGAFYICVKAPSGDANEFSDRAKKHDVLIVPGDGFKAEGYVRIAYCVSYEMIERSLPVFGEILEEYKRQ